MAGRIKGITVEIGGDTTKLQTALKGVNSEIKNTQAQLKDVEKLLKLDPGNTELLTQKQKLLKDAIAETKEKLATLKTAAEQANQALANGEITQEQYDALQREIVETEQKLKELEAQAKQAGVALQEIAAKGEKLKTVGDGITAAGKKFMPATLAITGLGTAAVKTAADFESAMSQVQATMGITKDSMSEVHGETVNTMDALNAIAQKMGAETKFSAIECGEALNYLALAGYNTEQMCDTLPTVLNLAAAGGFDLARASDMVTDAMSALGMGVNQADMMVDQMAKTASTTNTSVEQLGEGILKIGATAKSIKGGTAELNTALGILANNGIKGAEGGTHLRNVILALQSPMDKAADQMSALGVSTYDAEGNMRSLNDILGDLNRSMDGMTAAEKANIISTIFNKTDLAAVNALLASTGDEWDNLQQAIIDSGGAAQQMADTQLDNLQGQLTILKSALEGLAISMGQLLMPAIKTIVGWLQNFVNWLNSLDDGVKNTIVTVGLIVAAIGPVLIVVGKVISAVGTIMTILPKLASIISTVKTAFGALNAVLAANPIILVIAAIAALVAAFIYLWNNCEEFRQFWIDLWENIKEVAAAVGEWLAQAWQTMGEAITTAWTAICEFFVNVWDGIKNVFTTVVTAISTFLTNAWNTISTTIATVWNTIQTVTQTVWNAIASFFTAVWTGISNTVTTVIHAISSFITNAWNTIQSVTQTVWNAISTFFTTIWTAISTTVTTVMTTISTFISTAWNNIKTTVTTIANAIWNAITTAFNNMLSAISGTVNNIRNTIQNGFESAKNYIVNLASQAYSWGRDIISNIVAGIKSMISSVVSAVSNVASTIRSYLHFSVPDKGPLVDFESWMPDFMGGLAEGIRKNKPLIAKAISGVADVMDMKKALPDMNANLTASIGSGVNGGDYGEVKLSQPIMIDGKVITTVVSQIQYQRGKASLRNLGTV